MKLLLIEDDIDITNNLKLLLKENNYEFDNAYNITEGINKLSNNYDLIILDVSLPDGNGFSFYKNHLLEKNIPVVFLTAKDDEDDIVNGLELGAEDYITKPFSSKELLARIKRILLKKEKNKIIEIDNIKFDLEKMKVTKNNKEVKLTSLELKILYLFFNNLNRVITRESIIENIWNWTGNDVNDNTVTVYLKRIREKLGDNIIITVKGIGYRVDYEK